MKPIQWLFTSAFLLSVALSACVRSASKAPASPAATTAAPAGGSTQQVDTMATLLAQGQLTQTAIAGEIGGGEGPTSTPKPPTPTPTTPPTTPKPRPPAPTPTPSPQPTRPITAGVVPESYTLHEGEFPYCLARRFNVDPDELLALNGLVRGQRYYPGTVLKIPKSGKPFPGERALRPHPTTYTVVSGDTLYIVACKFGDVWPENIAQANGLALDDELTPGTTLQIP